MSKFKYLFFLLVIALQSQSLNAELVKIGEFYYILKEDKTAEITSERALSNLIYIASPFEITEDLANPGKFKVVINEPEVLVNFQIPPSIRYHGTNYRVTSIGESAFTGYSSLKSIEIPNSVTSIGDRAFSGCESLKNIDIPNSVTSIGKNAFYRCNSLKNINVVADNKEYVSFDGILYSKDRKLLICCPNGKKGNLVIPNTVATIGTEAFYDCSKITSIIIPNSVISIEDKAFSGCKSLVTIEIPNSVTSIGSSAFAYCSSLKNINIPKSVSSLVKNTFYNCSSLEYISIPNSITSIGDRAFSDCKSLKNIDIPNSVSSIETNAFDGCSSLTSINVSLDNTKYCSFEGILYLNEGKTIVDCPIGKKGTIEIPNSVTSIGPGSFSGCSMLTSIIIPNSVISIGENAFSGCSSLKNIEIPNSVTSIGEGAFNQCNSLTSINVSLGNTKYCSFEGILYSNEGKTIIDCPIGKKGTIEIPNSVTSIGPGSFSGCSLLTSIIIPNSVTSIGENAFSSCSSLKNIEIPNSVSFIGKNAFLSCKSLKKIKVPKNLVSILKKDYKEIDIIESDNPYTAEVKHKTNQNIPEEEKIDQSLAASEPTTKTKIDIIKEESKNYNQKTDFQELKDNMLTWEEFYTQNKKNNLTLENLSQIEAVINEEIEKWQLKDEFESTNEWKIRVNEKTRQQKVKELSEPLIAQYNKEIADIKEEESNLLKEYERYKLKLINEYYQKKTVDALKDFNEGNFDLEPYDADNGTFLIKSSIYGDILLPIPDREDARSFKENWENIRKNVMPEFIPFGEGVALAKIYFFNNEKEYVYDSHTEANYAVTDVKYNFKPVELADISLDDINTNLPALANADVSSQIISKTSNEAITPQKVEPSKNTVVASDRSDVDYAIPTGIVDANSTTYAVIIANENYKTLSKVPYAANDGEIMSKYLTTAVGLPQSHVKVYKNATVGSMAEAVSYMEDLGKAYGDKLNLIFYYAGHGVPDEKTKTALLLPVDGNPSIAKTCYSVDELVKNLGNLKANNVIVMLDACFSGATRNDDMLVAVRGVKLRTNDITPIGNMVFFSATQGDETAYPYEQERHGLFTYFLLKKLQENKGNVTLGELADYVIEKVKQKSMETNSKLQTPTVTVSPNLQSSWREIPLK